MSGARDLSEMFQGCGCCFYASYISVDNEPSSALWCNKREFRKKWQGDIFFYKWPLSSIESLFLCAPFSLQQIRCTTWEFLLPFFSRQKSCNTTEDVFSLCLGNTTAHKRGYIWVWWIHNITVCFSRLHVLYFPHLLPKAIWESSWPFSTATGPVLFFV